MRALALAALFLAASAQGARADSSAPGARVDDDFEEPPQPRSLAFGPLPPGQVTVSGDVGWLRSGLRADLGIGLDIDLVARVDAFLLHGGFGGQDGGYAGVRLSPLEGSFRMALAMEVGEVLVPLGTGSTDALVVRAEGTAGVDLEQYGVLYLRAALRGVRSGALGYTAWDRDEEAGVGYEYRLRGALVALEAFTWARPRLTGLGQWRLRVGYAF